MENDVKYIELEGKFLYVKVKVENRVILFVYKLNYVILQIESMIKILKCWKVFSFV